MITSKFSRQRWRHEVGLEMCTVLADRSATEFVHSHQNWKWLWNGTKNQHQIYLAFLHPFYSGCVFLQIEMFKNSTKTKNKIQSKFGFTACGSDWTRQDKSINTCASLKASVSSTVHTVIVLRQERSSSVWHPHGHERMLIIISRLEWMCCHWK